MVAALRGVEQGRRNATCARLTGHFLAHGFGLDVIDAVLLAWNGRNRPPLPEAEVRQTISAIVTRGQRQRADALPGTEGTLLEFLSGPWARECSHGERSTYQAVCIVEFERGLPPGAEMHVSYRELHCRGAVSPQRCGEVLRRLVRRGYLEFRPGRPGLQGRAATIHRLPLPNPEPLQR